VKAPPQRGARALIAGAAAIALLALQSCGGSTPMRPTTTTSTTMAPPRVTFLAEANSGDDFIGLGLTSSTATEFTLLLTATGVTDLYGFAVDVTFDPAVVMFDSAEAGDFLESVGTTVTTEVTEEPEGTLVIGQTRLGGQPGANGSGTLLTLHFKSVAAGTSAFTVANATAFDSTGTALTTEFFGGTATVPTQPTLPAR